LFLICFLLSKFDAFGANPDGEQGPTAGEHIRQYQKTKSFLSVNTRCFDVSEPPILSASAFFCWSGASICRVLFKVDENGDADKHVAVKNTDTGEVLQGEHAPKESNLDAWLEMHPNFQVKQG